MRKTKLTDFGEDKSFIETYNNMANAPEQRKQVYSNVGYLSAQTELNLTIARRLKIVQFLKDYPEIAKVPIRAPVFVMVSTPSLS